MAKDSALLSELHRIIGSRMDAGEIARPTEIVDDLFRSKPLEGPHADFYRAFAKKEIINSVRRMLRRVGMTDDPASPQLVLPGHTRLVKSYPVFRNGERALVPISLCTAKELSDHASLLRKQAKGCERHAVELEDYVAKAEQKGIPTIREHDQEEKFELA